MSGIHYQQKGRVQSMQDTNSLALDAKLKAELFCCCTMGTCTAWYVQPSLEWSSHTSHGTISHICHSRSKTRLMHSFLHRHHKEYPRVPPHLPRLNHLLHLLLVSLSKNTWTVKLESFISVLKPQSKWNFIV